MEVTTWERFVRRVILAAWRTSMFTLAIACFMLFNEAVVLQCSPKVTPEQCGELSKMRKNAEQCVKNNLAISLFFLWVYMRFQKTYDEISRKLEIEAKQKKLKEWLANESFTAQVLLEFHNVPNFTGPVRSEYVRSNYIGAKMVAEDYGLSLTRDSEKGIELSFQT